MKEQKQPNRAAANAAKPDMPGNASRCHGEITRPPDSSTRAGAVSMNQPDNVDLNEMLLRLKRREL